MTTTYCVQADVESIWSQVGVVLRSQDKQAIAIADVGHVADCIDMAAADMNVYLGRRYPNFASLVGNSWCKWTNAWIAAYYLASRRGNGVPKIIQDQYDNRLKVLLQIQDGILLLPDTTAPIGAYPFVSNYSPQLVGPGGAGVARNPFTSTGPSVPSNIKSTPYYGQWFWNWWY